MDIAQSMFVVYNIIIMLERIYNSIRAMAQCGDMRHDTTSLKDQSINIVKMSTMRNSNLGEIKLTLGQNQFCFPSTLKPRFDKIYLH